MAETPSLLATICDSAWIIALAIIIIFGVIFIKYNKWACFNLKESIHLMRNSKDTEGISTLQSFFVALSTRMGAGNIIGVAIAIIIGGVGSIFWMWVFSIFGASLCFAECTIGQIFKEKHDDGLYRGGPAYYAERGVKNRKFAVFISILFVISGMIFAGVEANNMSSSIHILAPDLSYLVISILIALVILFFVSRGLKKISKVLTFLTPFIAGLWIIAVVVILILNIQYLPETFVKIFQSGLNFEAIAGGLLGSCVIYGFKRGASSSEGGTGMIASIASSADDKHPVIQGYVQSLGVFFDIFVICTATALLLLACGGDIPTDADSAIDYLSHALSSGLFGETVGPIFAAVVLFFITFGTTLGLYTLTESNFRYVFKDNKKARYVLIAAFVIVIFILSLKKQEFVWQLVDICLAIMILSNIYCLWKLRPYLTRAVDDYKDKRKAGEEEPGFDVSVLDGLDVSGVTEWEKREDSDGTRRD